MDLWFILRKGKKLVISGSTCLVNGSQAQYKEGARDANVHLGITITLTFSGGFGAEKNHDGMQQMDGTS